MNQEQRRKYLIDYLLNEQPRYQRIIMPEKREEQRQLLRSLMNVRIAQDISDEFLTIQDGYLSDIREEKGLISMQDMYYAGFYPFPDEESIWGYWSKQALGK